MPLDKVVAILTAYDSGDSPTQIARTVQSDIRTIGGVLRQYRDRVNGAKALLMGLTPNAIAAWSEAIPIASKRGDHRPAKELLQATGIIVPQSSGDGASGAGARVAVQVVIGTLEHPIPHDPLR